MLTIYRVHALASSASRPFSRSSAPRISFSIFSRGKGFIDGLRKGDKSTGGSTAADDPNKLSSNVPVAPPDTINKTSLEAAKNDDSSIRKERSIFTAWRRAKGTSLDDVVSVSATTAVVTSTVANSSKASASGGKVFDIMSAIGFRGERGGKTTDQSDELRIDSDKRHNAAGGHKYRSDSNTNNRNTNSSFSGSRRIEDLLLTSLVTHLPLDTYAKKAIVDLTALSDLPVWKQNKFLPWMKEEDTVGTTGAGTTGADAVRLRTTCKSTTTTESTVIESEVAVNVESMPSSTSAALSSPIENVLFMVQEQIKRVYDSSKEGTESLTRGFDAVTSLLPQNNKGASPLNRPSADILDIVPVSVLPDSAKQAVRDLSVVGDKLLSQFENCRVKLQHPFLFNVGILRLYILHQQMQQQQLQFTHSSTSNTAAGPLLQFGEKNDAESDSIQTASQFIAKSQFYLRVASDVYKDFPYFMNENILLNCLMDEPSNYASSIKLPRHIVYIDHLTESIVVAIRGTKSIADVLTDLHLDATPFLRVESGFSVAKATGGGAGKSGQIVGNMIASLWGGGDPDEVVHAHVGMATSARALHDPVLAAIQRGRNMHEGKFKNYEIVITGHSLGAGTACLLSMLLASSPTVPTVTTYAFAPPPVLSKPIRPKIETKSQSKVSNASVKAAVEKLPVLNLSKCTIHCFIHNNDLIPRASHNEFVNMLSAVDVIDSLPWSPAERTFMLMRGGFSPIEVQQLEASMQDYHSSKISKENEGIQLEVPGTVHVLAPALPTAAGAAGTGEGGSPASARGDTYTLRTLSSPDEVFNGFLFTGDSMAHDHLVASYMQAMVKVNTAASCATASATYQK